MLYVMRVVALPIVCQAKRSRVFGAALLLLLAAACARTGLHPGDLGEDDEPSGAGSSSTSSGGKTGVTGSSGAPAKPLPIAGAPTQQMGGQPNAGQPSAGQPSTEPPDPPIEMPPGCQPSPEDCNGRDDDCNGAVDDLPAQACDGGGFRFCVAGRMSECPKRCEVCVPGSVRVCQNSYCLYWGEQECAGDGQGFGGCEEAQPPPECTAIAKKLHDSRELEQCCLDSGYCCLDEHDLDGDGDHREMLGACGDIACQ
jgi:hypothetical protein